MKSQREKLIDKLSDAMDRDGATAFVDRVIEEAMNPDADLTLGCDCDQIGDPDATRHASDCDWATQQKKAG